VSFAPSQSLLNDNLCPGCGRQLTIGVLHRVEQLADRKPDEVPIDVIPFKHLVPLEEVVGEALGVGRDTAHVHKMYESMVAALGSEFEILLNSPIPDIEKNSNDRVALGIDRMRRGEVQATAGYDGVFGVIQVLPGVPPTPAARDAEPGTQMGLFG